MTEYEIGDDEYEETEEVNTSYDQNQPIGDEPQALNTELSNSEPIDAETGEDFYTIQTGGQSPKIGEFQTVWKQLGYESTDSEYQKVKGLLDRSESPEHEDDLKRWAGNWGVDEDLVFKVFEQEFGGMYEEDYANESLNLDGTGVARATRGINPNKTVNQIIRFIYVSKSDCPICKQYDGQSWAVDSPNRPVIPRLEKGNKSRPFTHPHCKCKWVNVFSDQEVKSSEVNKADFERAAKWYGKGYYNLPVTQQKLIMIDMLKQSLGMEADAEEDIVDPVPLASMAQMAFDTIKPMLKHKLGIGEAFLGQPHAEQHNYGIQSMLDDIVSKSLSKDEKKEIEESTELENDFSLNTLLELVADRLAKKIGKKLGVESTKPFGQPLSADDQEDSYFCPNCIFEGTRKQVQMHTRDVHGLELGHEADIHDYYCPVCEQGFHTEQDKWAHMDIEHDVNVESIATEGGRGSGRMGHQKWMLAGESGEECPNCMMITERADGKCILCGN